MGLFSGIGKLIGGVAKGIGKVAKIGVGALGVASKLGLPIPLGGVAGSIAGAILSSKRPMGTTTTKLQVRSPAVLRGNVTQGGYSGRAAQIWGNRPPPSVLRASPVMPGGAIASPRGILSLSPSPPAAYSGAAAPVKRKRRKASSTRKRSTAKRRGRKLKFGSAAYRKKYLGQGKKKRRRRAA